MENNTKRHIAKIAIILIVIVIVISVITRVYQTNKMLDNASFTIGVIVSGQIGKATVQYKYKDRQGIEHFSSTSGNLKILPKGSSVLIIYDSSYSNISKMLYNVNVLSFSYGHDMNNIFDKKALDTLKFYW